MGGALVIVMEDTRGMPNPPNEATRLELEYWRAILADVQELNDLIRRAATECVAIPVKVLEALVAPESHRGEHLLAASRDSNDVMETLSHMHEPLLRVLALVEGRVNVLLADDE